MFVSRVPLNDHIDCSQWEQVSKLYQQLAPSLVTKARYAVKSHAVAQDLVHDVFLQLWAKKPCFPCEKKAYSWLYKATHNATIDHWRKASNRFRHLALQDYGSDQLRVACDAPIRFENASIIQKFAGRLTDTQLRIVAYRFVDGMEVQRIASMCGISTKSVQRRLRDAERILRDIWRGEDNQ